MAFPPSPTPNQLHIEAGRQYIFLHHFHDTSSGWFLTGAIIATLNMLGHKIENLADGSDPDDAVNLGQLERIVHKSPAVHVTTIRPDDPENGTLWFSTTQWKLFMYYDVWFQLV